ncbi:MAG: sigma-70 family RNA polymerase sigma factor [Phycisphaerae bacterium]|nr:sigma-70 family RNA polymerase sigma factor [Phycisphaerae bacterium]NIP50580.1 sigma-70 family RNA polymerase sigma factor [Phycisphaerae bacterium]NIS50791.1 sigma-70 family RNA polymerase sigma factor [Phycisphaerae bacterium]NIU07468.1 sigma-70 family RNA polymerase sigma factor [Phycisphaerae bacterium]NIU55058.1 sigma-70 family RNA polymerase sigma factor [Phycisphaerae bacterium]
MLEDKLLVWKLKRGNSDALESIYEKYKRDLLALAIALSNDRDAAEDIVHDVFVSFAEFAEKLQLRTNLRSYLLSCIANRARNLHREQCRQTIRLDIAEAIGSDSDGPEQTVIASEEMQRVGRAMLLLSYDQREVIILHLQGGMRFRAIAQSQDVSINTIQSRYRYGLKKLRSLLNGEAEK